MAYHPLNLGLRFLLEMGALVAVGAWGWSLTSGPLRWLAMILIPIVLATAWATFAVPDDKSRSGNAPVPVPGAVRLVLELAVFTFGAWSLIATGRPLWGFALAGLVIVHYLLSIERIGWLLGR
jgi:hypothetical protein